MVVRFGKIESVVKCKILIVFIMFVDFIGDNSGIIYNIYE